MAKERASVAATQPGHSALARGHEEIRRRRRRRALSGVLLALAGALCLLGLRPHPGPAGGLEARLLWGLAAACVVGTAVCWPRGDARRWARGAQGEMATAELLDRLGGRHWVVLHDLAVPGSRANIDHLVIGPTGLWVVDSKSYRSRVRARRGQLWAGSTQVDLGSVIWEAGVVSRVLGERARAVVAVHEAHRPGLPRRGRSCQGARALPATSLVRRLRRGRYLRPRLSPRRVRQLAALATSELSAGGDMPASPGRAGRSPLVSK